MFKTEGAQGRSRFKLRGGAEAVPAQALRWLERMLAASPDPAYFFDMQSHRLLAVNHLLTRLLGFRWEELLAMTLEDLRPMEEIPALLKRLKYDPPVGSVNSRYIRQDGSLLYVRFYYRDNFYLDHEGKERAIRLVVITQADTTPLIGLEVAPLTHVSRSERRGRQRSSVTRVAAQR